MSLSARLPGRTEVVYPDSDGEPIADNTLQWEWIVTVKNNLDVLFHNDPNVFVAGDLLWYPVEGDNVTRSAPDAMVAFGRPKGHRGSYKQWVEGGIAPHVVFEILSPGNRAGRVVRKFHFYERFGVEECYVYDPHEFELTGWLRQGEAFDEIPEMDGWMSPRLGVRFDLSTGELRISHPNGMPFLTYVELGREVEKLKREVDDIARELDGLVQQRDEHLRKRDDASRQRDEEHQRAERLAEKLRALGIDPNA